MDSYAYSARSDLGFSLFLDRRCKIVYFIGKRKKAALTLLALLALLALWYTSTSTDAAAKHRLLYIGSAKGTHNFLFFSEEKTSSFFSKEKTSYFFIGNAEGTHNLVEAYELLAENGGV
jgi:hypothetical protein